MLASIDLVSFTKQRFNQINLSHFSVQYAQQNSILHLLNCKPSQKSGTPFCDFTNICHLDGKNHTTVTNLIRVNYVNLFLFFIF